MNRIVVATHNPSKAREMRQILADGLPGYEILTLADFPPAPEPEETGGTYAENAAIKARAAADATGELAIADDAGLEVDALPGVLGVRSKRFVGEATPFPEKIRQVLERLRGVPEDRRGARFHCCVALAGPGSERPSPPPMPELLRGPEPIHGAIVFTATCEGRIATEPRGTGGFGYDPIFWLPNLSRTMAELSPEEKHAVSHRGKVLRSVTIYLGS